MGLRRSAASVAALAVVFGVASGCTPRDQSTPAPTPTDAPSATPASAAPSLAPVEPLATAPFTVVALTTTAGEPIAGYRLAGKPDGTAVIDTGAGAVILVNHELVRDEGRERTHGTRGAFVSAWVPSTDAVALTDGHDFINSIQYWDYRTEAWGGSPVPPSGAKASDFPRSLSHLCAASGVDERLGTSAGVGYAAPLFITAEESDANGRIFAIDASGTAYQVPALGLGRREKAAFAVGTGDATVVVLNEDYDQAQVSVYVGAKTSSGNPVERAGLANGSLYVLGDASDGALSDATWRKRHRVGEAVPVELSAAPIDTQAPGASQQRQADERGLTFNRLEDGDFDPLHPNDYYFLTTTGGKRIPGEGDSRDSGGLWRLRFYDVANPQLGGTLTLLLDGSERPRSHGGVGRAIDGPDNIEVTEDGVIVIQEDPGIHSHRPRLIAYQIDTGDLAVAAYSPDPAASLASVTDSGGGKRIESVGLVDASSIWGDGWYIFGAQGHFTDGLSDAIGAAAARAADEYGGLYALYVPDWNVVFADEQAP